MLPLPNLNLMRVIEPPGMVNGSIIVLAIHLRFFVNRAVRGHNADPIPCHMAEHDMRKTPIQLHSQTIALILIN